MSAQPPALCLGCGRPVPGALGFCPVCLLRRAAAGEEEADSLEASFKDPLQIPAEDLSGTRFEHYQLLQGPDGQPLELGRGAMGVTYQAEDLSLRRPVALKVIGQRCLGDEAARRRFVREARAAGRVRHPNVASVYHLGQRGGQYFYAMEWVAGETLEAWLKREGLLEVKLALGIVGQVAAGLGALHEQGLVHRDVKPSNIMLSRGDGGAVNAKLIDLGFAKAVQEAGSQTTVSLPGAFVGTPAYASPEQFAGMPVDIRSDLYSLGVTLWVMVTGQTPFRGPSAEVMYQHQHAPLPLEQLKDVPQAVVVLLEKLLEKGPAQRFQTPNELLKVIPTITDAVDPRHGITRQRLQKIPPATSHAVTRKRPGRLVPKKISIARLPVTGSEVFGREEDIAFLDRAWANKDINVVTIVAWAGVGKSTLVNHWLRRMATDRYRSAQFVFGWSFYRQGTSGGTSSADEFIDAALLWFGDPDPRLGTAWEKGERLAKLIAHRRTLLVLDGLEPLQNPPGPEEGRLREPSLQALLLELAAFNGGLCVITTRLSVADIADHERTSALRRDLEHLSSQAGAQLLRALGVRGPEAEVCRASEEFQGHCLALALLGSYLSDVYNGDVRCRDQVPTRLVDDVRQGGHARKIMASYQRWWGEGPELSVLRLLGFFDRPADEKALMALLKPPAIPSLTEPLTGLNPSAWRTLLARLRRARLLAGEDPLQPGQLDTHPLVREYFGEQLRSQRPGAWQEGNRRLYEHYQALAPERPDTLRAMEPLFLAVACGCQAGRFRDALHEVYLPRIQRGDAAYSAKVLGARGALLSVLAYFFEEDRWGSPAQRGVEGQSLTAEDQLFVLMQAGMYLTATRGNGTPDSRACFERAEALCNLLNRPLHLYSALMGQWLFSLHTDKMAVTMQLAGRVFGLAQEQNDPALMVGGYRALAVTRYYLGNFEAAEQYAKRGVELWRLGAVQSPIEQVNPPAVICLGYAALCEWHLGETASCQTAMAETICLAKELSDAYALAEALFFAAMLGHFERNAAEVERLASGLIEVCMRHNFALYLAGGEILRGQARSASGHSAEGIACIEDGIRDWRASGSRLLLPYWLALKAEALHLADRSSEALKSIREAEALGEGSEERWCSAELHRLRGVFLATLGADVAQIEASFCEAIRIARQQKSISLTKRAEESYAEYRSRKA